MRPLLVGFVRSFRYSMLVFLTYRFLNSASLSHDSWLLLQCKHDYAVHSWPLLHTTLCKNCAIHATLEVSSLWGHWEALQHLAGKWWHLWLKLVAALFFPTACLSSSVCIGPFSLSAYWPLLSVCLLICLPCCPLTSPLFAVWRQFTVCISIDQSRSSIFTRPPWGTNCPPPGINLHNTSLML